MDKDFNKKFHELQDKYAEKFGENIAMFQVSNEDAENILEILQRCIDTNKPYEYPEMPDDCIF